jgi:hypothetical protein
MRYKASRDANHRDIVVTLTKRGVSAWDLSTSGGGVADIVTYYRSYTVFIEIKFGKDAVLKKTQLWFLGMWNGFCGIARDENEAFALATDPVKHALTHEQKQKLLAMHAVMKTKHISLNTVMKAIL